MANRIQVRRDTLAGWTAANPILAQGEFGYITNGASGTFLKIGDGVTAFLSLPYAAINGVASAAGSGPLTLAYDPTTKALSGSVVLTNRPTITQKTNAQRLAFTPLLGEIVYTTDTGLFYRGDGATVGGVSSPTGFTNQQLVDFGFIVPRNSLTLACSEDARTLASTALIPKGYCLGNSIMGGAGVATELEQFWTQTGQKLVAHYGVGNYGDWCGQNCAIGGQGIANVLMYVADNADNSLKLPQRGEMFKSTTNYKWVSVMTIANDPGLYTAATYERLIRLLCMSVKRKGLDGFMMIDPPKMDPTRTTLLHTQANFGDYADVCRRQAAIWGWSVVDTKAYFDYLHEQGVSVANFLAVNDGVHPNAFGHNLIAALWFECYVSPFQAPHSGPAQNRPVGDGRTQIVSNYISMIPSNAYTPTLFSGMNVRKSARMLQTLEVPTNCFVIASGQNMRWTAPIGSKGAIVQYLDDTTNTGTATISFNGGVSMATGVTKNGGSKTENAIYYPFAENLAFADGYTGYLEIAAVGGEMKILGVAWIGNALSEYHDVWPDATEVGTWSDTTISMSGNNYGYGVPPARQSSGIGDTLTLLWYGTCLNMFYEIATTNGKFSLTTDGSLVTTFDCYTSGGSPRGSAQKLHHNIALGWHTSVFTVVAKNASSSGNNVKLGGFRVQSSSPDPKTRELVVAYGETVQLPDYWDSATIVRVIAGSPSIVRFVPGQNTFTLTGTAGDKAVVRFVR